MKGDFYDFWINVPQWTIKQLVCLLKGYDPAVLDAPTDEENLETKKYLLQEFQEWEVWAGDCPGINDQKGGWGDRPPILQRPIDAKILVNWANKKIGVVIPSELEALINKGPAKKKQDQPADKRELVTYWQILAVLCKHSNLNLDKPYEAAAIIQKWGALNTIKLPSKSDTIAKKLTAVKEYLKSL